MPDTNTLTDALAPMLRRLLTMAERDAELRGELRAAAIAILDATDADSTTDESEGLATVSARMHEQVDSAERLLDEAHRGEGSQRAATDFDASRRNGHASREPLPPLTLGQGNPQGPPPTPSYPRKYAVSADVELAEIEESCWVKAEASRWAAKKRRLIAGGASIAADIEPTDRELIARARQLPECFLWMVHPSGPSPASSRPWEEVGGCFEALAEAVALVRQLVEMEDPDRDDLELGYHLLAEAQSALRAAALELEGQNDSDQHKVFKWLRQAAHDNSIYITHHMKADDPADPANWADLIERIRGANRRYDSKRQGEKNRRKLLGKVKHKASLIESEPEQAGEHWRILVGTVDELVQGGLPPSSRELRELLAPHVDSLPDDLEPSPDFLLVLREIDRQLASEPAAESHAPAPPTQEVIETARLLSGQAVVLIGGEKRLENQRSLEEAFDLSELIWIETREHQSIDGFEAYVARPEVALVLLAIRWSSHSYGDVKRFCEQYDKPLVRLPGGYNPNQVAAQIMSQCSERLQSS